MASLSTSLALSTGGSSEGSKAHTIPVVFWGILDVKFDPRRPRHQCLQVLELGDGRLSRFSHHGKHIKDRFESDYRYSNPIKRQALVENKRCTHDTFQDEGYTHLRPRTKSYARHYTEGLAAQICSDLSLSSNDAVVLKLCNRSRGAGVVVVKRQDIDSVLRKLLNPPSPSELDLWFESQAANALQRCFDDVLEEQCQHWWANECPCFLAEVCCHSLPVEKDCGTNEFFDGTLRVAFALKRSLDDLDKQWKDQEVCSFDVDWLGGYWKLPSKALESNRDNEREKGVTPADLHARVVSSFNSREKRTAEVSEDHLQEVYSILTPALQAIFRAGNLGVSAILSKYQNDKLFCSFVLARMAADQRNCNASAKKVRSLLDLAQNLVPKQGKESIQSERCVLSYIKRNESVMCMCAGSWRESIPLLQASLEWLPHNASSFYFLGLCYQKLSEFDAAIACLQKSILLDPDFKQPYVLLGSCLMQRALYTQAREAGLACLRRHPDSLVAKFNIAQAIYHMMSSGSISDVTDLEDIDGTISLERQARDFFECAQRNVPEQWNSVDQSMLEYFQTASEERSQLPRQPVHVWNVYGWRP